MWRFNSQFLSTAAATGAAGREAWAEVGAGAAREPSRAGKLRSVRARPSEPGTSSL